MSISSEITSMGENLKKDYQSIANLGADLTNVDKNIENIAELLDGVYDNLPKTEYQEGTEITLENCLKGKLDFDNGVVGYGQTEQAILPSEYQQVEYIQGSGSQFIITDTYIDNNNISIKTKITTPNMPSVEQDIVGNQDNTTGRFILGLSVNKVFLYSKYSGTADINAWSGEYSGEQTLEIETIFNQSTNTKTLKVNGTSYSETYTKSISNSNNAVQVFSNGNGESRFIGKVYYLKLYKGDILSLDLYPCYRISDNVIGMYDLVSNTFLTNSGTETFTKGANAPTPSQEIPIKCVTGNQDVVVSGKNYWGGTLYNGQTNGVGVWSSQTSRVTNTSSGTDKSTLKLKAGTYTLSIQNLNNAILLTKDENGNILDNFATYWRPLPLTFELTQEGYVYFSAKKSDDSNITPSDYFPMIANGTDTTYEPYITPTSYQLSLGDIELCGIGDYKDELVYDVDEDKVYKNVAIKKLVLDGNETITNDYTAFDISLPNRAILGEGAYCNYYTYDSRSSGMASLDNYTFAFQAVKVFIQNKDYSSVDSFKGWLNVNKPIIYYPLYTTQKTEITDTTLVNQIKALYYSHSNNGTTIITSNGNLPMIIKCRGLKGE